MPVQAADVTLSYLNYLIRKSNKLCQKNGWDRHWTDAGCCLHLEASEFIEALRGKGNSPPEEEAADVLFVLFSMLHHNSIPIENVLGALDEKISTKLEEEVC